ncbi:hypothetical protein PN499_23320 [Kamptonema animale CS-326]|jgi:DNA-binding IclR family transcriptional regulator|uniref:hypothetical protein n=1 Tax=Kamptonema animale TaxID=92934 RepID=UPI00232BAE6A|nr:hypothetical protein [Kamptonema animale]MDB9514136.1 hypothetical protein [Kamptonema animale CS-326]
MNIKTQIQILNFLKTPQRANTVAREFKLDKQATYRLLKKLEVNKIARTYWEKGTKLYEVNLNEFMNE